MLFPKDKAKALKRIQRLAHGNEQLLDSFKQQLDVIAKDLLLPYDSSQDEKDILTVGACFALQNPGYPVEPRHLMHYGVQVLNGEQSLDTGMLSRHLRNRVQRRTDYTTSLCLQLLLMNHESDAIQQSRPILENVFHHALNWASIDKTNQKKQCVVDAMHQLKEATLMQFDNKKAGFDFQACQSIAKATQELAIQLPRGLEQSHIDTFIQSTKPYIRCDRIKAALACLIGAALGLLAGCALGGLPGAIIGAAAGMTLFGAGYIHRDQESHPLTRVARAAQATR